MGKRYADMTPEERAKQRAHVKAYRERNREKVARFQRAYREANASKLRRAARVKYRQSVGLSGEGTARVLGPGVPLAKRRLSRWVRPGFAELMASWTYQQARFDYARWCDEIDRDFERRAEAAQLQASIRARAAADDSGPRWFYEITRTPGGHVVCRSFRRSIPAEPSY